MVKRMESTLEGLENFGGPHLVPWLEDHNIDPLKVMFLKIGRGIEGNYFCVEIASHPPHNNLLYFPIPDFLLSR